MRHTGTWRRKTDAGQWRRIAASTLCAGVFAASPALAGEEDVDLVKQVLVVAAERCGLALTDPEGFAAKVPEWPDMEAQKSEDDHVWLFSGMAKRDGAPYDLGEELDLENLEEADLANLEPFIQTDVEMYGTTTGKMVTCSVSTSWIEEMATGKLDESVERIDAYFQAALPEAFPKARKAGSNVLRQPHTDLSYASSGYDEDVPRPTYVLTDWAEGDAPALVVMIMTGSIEVYTFREVRAP